MQNARRMLPRLGIGVRVPTIVPLARRTQVLGSTTGDRAQEMAGPLLFVIIFSPPCDFPRLLFCTADLCVCVLFLYLEGL